MEYKFNSVNIFYKNIFLKRIKFKNFFSVDEFKCNFKDEFVKNYYITISFDNRECPILNCNFLKSYLIDKKLFEVELKNELTKDTWKIIHYIDILEFIADSDFVDKTLRISSNKVFSISFASIIAQRNLEIIKILFKELQNNNQLICNFLLRDIIENIKLYLYFIRGAIKEETIINEYGTFKREIVFNKVNEAITKTLSSENKDWNYNIKKILKDNPSLTLWEEDLQKVINLNNRCNSIIHKLGITKLLPNQIKYSKQTITINDVYICIKLFITLIICYDGKEISSSDYIDYLDLDMEPPKDSQYWVAPIIQEFINNEYNSKEKNNLKEMSYMDIK